MIVKTTEDRDFLFICEDCDVILLRLRTSSSLVITRGVNIILVCPICNEDIEFTYEAIESIVKQYEQDKGENPPPPPDDVPTI